MSRVTQQGSGRKLAVVVGSGFGGAVSALRLAQSGALDVMLLERGHRYQPEDFPRFKLPDTWTSDDELKTSKRLPEVARFAWAFDQGLWELRNLGGLQVAQAAGYGGGSLVYASVHLRPPERVFSNWPQHRCSNVQCAACGRGRIDLALLGEHYETVEAMLGVSPAPESWAKTREFVSACGQLERKAFSPPLAINFTTPERGPADPARPACNGCGNCMIGCGEGAKNTLDHNYLRQAEAAGLRVRTLAEVVTLQDLWQGGGARSGRRYRIHYKNHFLGARAERLDADFVFLCAGAIGSTEILKRSVHKQHLPARLSDPTTKARAEGLGNLGKRFWANGDSVGIVFDTKEPWHSTAGPTITRSTYHRSARRAPRATQASCRSGAEDLWFLVQEGGFPPSLRRALGVFRSPLWLTRNAFNAGSAAGGSAPGGSAPAPVRGASAARAHVLTKVEAFVGGLPALLHTQRRLRTLQGSLGKTGADDQDFWLQVLPQALRGFGAAGFGLNKTVSHELGDMLQRFLRELQRDPQQGLLSWGVRWFARPLFAEESFIKVALRAVQSRLPRVGSLLDSNSSSQLLDRLATLLFFGTDPGEHMALLLAMGPDSEWRLDWQDPRYSSPSPHLQRGSRGLRATPVRNGQVARLYRAQERLMRDITSKSGGQLRTNPGWTLGRRPITVHSQGGCSMSDKPERGVVDATGEVWHQPGLFVMDGSVFPSSVGVNPSNTIAALTELNIRHFLAREFPEARATLDAATSAGKRQQPRRELPDLEAIASVLEMPATAELELQAKPMQLVWEERLDGYVSPAGQSRLTLESDVDDFEVAYRQGVRAGTALHLRLEAAIPDLDEFLDSKIKRVAIRGKLWLRADPNDARRTEYEVLDDSWLRLDLTPAPVDPSRARGKAGVRLAEPAQRPATMRYRLRLKVNAGASSAPASAGSPSPSVQATAHTHVLRGIKYLTDDPGFDAWMDLTTLFTVLEDDHRNTLHAGIVRVHLDDFILRQLPSFDVTTASGGHDDLPAPAKLLGLLRFGRYFFGDLKHIYEPLGF